MLLLSPICGVNRVKNLKPYDLTANRTKYTNVFLIIIYMQGDRLKTCLYKHNRIPRTSQAFGPGTDLTICKIVSGSPGWKDAIFCLPHRDAPVFYALQKQPGSFQKIYIQSNE